MLKLMRTNHQITIEKKNKNMIIKLINVTKNNNNNNNGIKVYNEVKKCEEEEEEENLRCLFCVAFVVHFRYLLNLFYMHTHIPTNLHAI